jgi:hypothetical protein
MLKSVEISCARAESMKQWLVVPSIVTPPFLSFEKKLQLHYFFYELMLPNPMISKKID